MLFNIAVCGFEGIITTAALFKTPKKLTILLPWRIDYLKIMNWWHTNFLMDKISEVFVKLSMIIDY